MYISKWLERRITRNVLITLTAGVLFLAYQIAFQWFDGLTFISTIGFTLIGTVFIVPFLTVLYYMGLK